MSAPAKPDTTPTGSFGTAQAEQELLSLLSEQEEADEAKDMQDASEDDSEQPEAETATPDDEDDIEREDDTPEEPEPPKLRKVKVDGEDVEVTEDELVRGYSREAHFTKKMQALAQEKAKISSEQQAIQSERELYATRLSELAKAMESNLTPLANTDWEKLRAEDPIAYAEQFTTYQLAKERHERVQQERAAVEQRLAETAMQQHQAHVQAEREKLFDAIPEWKDEAARKADKEKLLEFAKNTGFSEEDFNGVSDHRLVVVLRKAMLHDAAVKAAASQKTVVEQKIEKAKVARPGSGTKPRVVSEFVKSAEKLAKTGSLRHGRDAMAQLLAAEESARRG